jgi:hypothetical protein
VIGEPSSKGALQEIVAELWVTLLAPTFPGASGTDTGITVLLGALGDPGPAAL